MTYLSTLADRLDPYVAGEQPEGGGWIKLNTNESPYPPAPGVTAVLRSWEFLGEGGANLRLYPDPSANALRDALARLHNVSRENVFIGNGSDEVLSFAFAAFFAGLRYATPEIGYSFYPSYARLFGAETQLVPMLDGMAVNVDGLIAAEAPVILANPNAPTSVAVPRSDILRMREVLHSHGDPLVVDEAYGAFSDCSVIGDAIGYDNLLVIRTFSKAYALAGMRVGYAIGAADLIAGLERARDSFNSYPVDRVAQAAALAAVQDTPYMESCVRRIAATRDAVRLALIELGFEAPPSQTNFLFVRHSNIHGRELYERLRERHILARHFNKPKIEDYLRITVGTDEQMSALVDVLRDILTEHRS